MVPECFGSVWVTFAGCEEVLRLALMLKAKVESLSRRKPTWIEKIAGSTNDNDDDDIDDDSDNPMSYHVLKAYCVPDTSHTF